MTDSTLDSDRISSSAKRTVLGAAGRRIKQTDNSMRHLKLERFYTPRRINERMAIADGPMKTFLLWGIKALPPYPYHGRLLTLEDTGGVLQRGVRDPVDDRRETGLGGISPRALTVMRENHDIVLATGRRTLNLCVDRLKNRRNIGGGI